MFTTDRDFLALEPNLFRDCATTGQRLVSATGSIAGTTLTLAAADVDLDAAGIGAGHIVRVDETPYEVVARLSPATLTISRLRAAPNDPVLPPSPATSKPVQIVTFRPQAAVAHDQLLRMLGVEPGSTPGAPDRITEADITNPGDLRHLEALSTLYLIYIAAAGISIGWADNPVWNRAQHYLQRADAERRRVQVRIDLDGDGQFDATRRPNILHLTRAF